MTVKIWKRNGPRITKTTFEVEGPILPDFNTKYEATVITIMILALK